MTRTRYRPPGCASLLAAVVLVSSTAGPAPAGDQALVRGMIEVIDPTARKVTVRTDGGEDLTLTADATSSLSVDGKRATFNQLVRGQRVRVTYEKAGAANRLVSLRTAVPTEADLSRDVREVLKTAKGYSFAQKEKYREKVREVIDDVDDRIEDLRARAKASGADARAKAAERIDALKRKRDELERRLERATPAVEAAWEDIKAGVAGAADDLGKALDEFRSPPPPK